MKNKEEVDVYRSELLAEKNRYEKFDKIIMAIKNERLRQDNLWGEQNHPIIDSTFISDKMYLRYDIPSEENCKYMCETLSKNNDLTWGDIILEELVEALCAKNKEDMKTELIQCASVIFAAIESLDRNGK